MKESFEFLKYIKYKPLSRSLSVGKIKKFEKMNGIILPDDYKYFLTHIGNGICVFLENHFLSYGRRYRKRIVKGFDRDTLNKQNNLLSKEFLFDKAFMRRDGERPIDWFKDCINPNLDNVSLCDQCKNACFCPFADTYKICEKYGKPFYSGMLPIYDAGCTYQYCLVLTGSHKGEVWMDNDGMDIIPTDKSFTEFLKKVCNEKCSL